MQGFNYIYKFYRPEMMKNNFLDTSDDEILNFKMKLPSKFFRYSFKISFDESIFNSHKDPRSYNITQNRKCNNNSNNKMNVNIYFFIFFSPKFCSLYNKYCELL